MGDRLVGADRACLYSIVPLTPEQEKELGKQREAREKVFANISRVEYSDICHPMFSLRKCDEEIKGEWHDVDAQ